MPDPVEPAVVLLRLARTFDEYTQSLFATNGDALRLILEAEGPEAVVEAVLVAANQDPR